MIKELINDFINHITEHLEDIYNEFSLQHELGIFLRNNLSNYKIQFERNVSYFSNLNCSAFVKKEIDLVIYNFDKTEKYGIELKHPKNGQYPETMFSFIKDIKFMEQVKEVLNFNKTFVFTLVCDKNFYRGNCPNRIYKFFRSQEIITGTISKPTGKKDEVLDIKGHYKIDWKTLETDMAYFLIEI